MAVGTTNGAYQTYYQSVGSAVGPFKQVFYDALVNTFNWTRSGSEGCSHHRRCDGPCGGRVAGRPDRCGFGV